MAAIRAKHTKPELVVRMLLHQMGRRFRLHAPDLPGKPDIVLPKIRTIVHVRGCFWHGHRCLGGRTPAANHGYWAPKIAGNKFRDRKNDARLRRMGWRVKTIWECQVRRSTGESLWAALEQLTGHAATRKPALGGLRRADEALKKLRQRKKAVSKTQRS